MSLTELEQHVVDEIDRRGEELVELASALIRFDTEAREPEHPPREEAAFQEYLAGRLAALGAQIDLWEPAREDVHGSRLVPAGGLGFAGRPQLAARFPGAGGGRSLLLNGHIDVVSSAPRDAWTSDPNEPEVRHGKLYGRGSCDMKGGIAAMTFAAEVIAALGVRVSGIGVRVEPGRRFFCSPETRHPIPEPRSIPGNTSGFASLQCVPGGIGSTIRSSRIDPPVVCAGNQYGVVVSPERIRRCQKM